MADSSSVPRNQARRFGIAIAAIVAVAAMVTRRADAELLGSGASARLGIVGSTMRLHDAPRSDLFEAFSREHYAVMAALPHASPIGPNLDEVLHLVVERRFFFAPDVHVTIFSGRDLVVANVGGARVSVIPNGFSPQQGGLVALTCLF